MRKKKVNNSKRLATISRITEYLRIHFKEELPKKHNQLYGKYLDLQGIDTKGKKLRDLAIMCYESGMLDKYKPETKTRRPKKLAPHRNEVNNIYESQRWKDLKSVVYKLYSFKCMKCLEKETEMHVDHIYPVSRFPERKWDLSNLQILCRHCNMEKSNLNEIDYRSEDEKKICNDYLNGDI